MMEALLTMEVFDIEPGHVDLFREIGLDAAGVFADPRVRVWRSLPDRENATLDHVRADGSKIRLHIKRYPAAESEVARREVAGCRLLLDAGIPAAPIKAQGRMADGRSFIILEDLAGYIPGDKLVEQGFPFERLLAPTAALAGRLHDARLHHRDLYLCHFMVRETPNGIDARLIDMARVAKLNNPLTRRRWIVKDLAQFWYSTLKLPVTDEQRIRWLSLYAGQRGVDAGDFLPAVRDKSKAISRHDIGLNRRQPQRNVSIPAE